MSLYERILREKFQELSPLVQKMHCYEKGNTLTGTVTIKRGKSFIAKILNPLMRLPQEQSNALLILKLEEKQEKELWQRTFGADTFSSTQYQEANQMVESMGLVKMYFDVFTDNGSLCTTLVKTTIFWMSVPKWLAVNISSKAEEREGKVLFKVKVQTFNGNEVITYNGMIDSLK